MLYSRHIVERSYILAPDRTKIWILCHCIIFCCDTISENEISSLGKKSENISRTDTDEISLWKEKPWWIFEWWSTIKKNRLEFFRSRTRKIWKCDCSRKWTNQSNAQKNSYNRSFSFYRRKEKKRNQKHTYIDSKSDKGPYLSRTPDAKKNKKPEWKGNKKPEERKGIFCKSTIIDGVWENFHNQAIRKYFMRIVSFFFGDFKGKFFFLFCLLGSLFSI